MRRALVAMTLTFALSTPALAKPATPKPNTVKATVKAPGFRVIQRLAKRGKTRFRAHGKGKAIGGARFIEAVSSQRPRAVQLVVVEKVGATWKLRHRVSVAMAKKPTKRSEGCDPEGSQKTAGVVFVRDYDSDGKLEAYARTITCWSMPAIGPSTHRTMAIYNLDGKPSLSMKAAFGHNALPTAAGAEHVRARFVDTNKDGHPDVVLTSRHEYPGEKKRRTKRVYTWDGDGDRYVLKKGKRRKGKR